MDTNTPDEALSTEAELRELQAAAERSMTDPVMWAETAAQMAELRAQMAELRAQMDSLAREAARPRSLLQRLFGE